MQSRVGKVWAADATLVFGVVCIAWSGLLVRWADVSGFTAAFYRMLFAAAVLAPLALFRSLANGAGPDKSATGRSSNARSDSTALPTAREWFLAALAGALFSCDNVLFNLAVQRSPVGIATLLANLSPVFVGLGAWLLYREAPSRSFWTGVVLATVGCACMGGSGHLLSGGTPGPAGGGGGLLAVVASVFFAGYLMVVARARVSAGTITFTTLSVCWSALFLGIVCVATRQPLAGFMPHTWIALLGLGLVSQTCGYLAIIYALGRLPPTITSVGLLAQAPVTAVIAAGVLHEGLNAAQIVGGLITLAGIYVVTRRPAPAMAEAAPAA